MGMELELGLGLPNQGGLDLNCCSNEMEIIRRRRRHGRCSSKDSPPPPPHRDNCRSVTSVDDGEEVNSKNLSLLLWSGQPNDDHHEDACRLDDEE